MVGSDFPLYATVGRAEIVSRLHGPIRQHWTGELLVANGHAVLLARLSTYVWQVVAPDTVRRVVRQPPDPAKRRPWRRQEIPRDTWLFLQPSARSKFFYAGKARNLPLGGHGSGGGGPFHKSWTDFELRPTLPVDLWQQLRVHSLRIDGTIHELPPGDHTGDLSDALDTVLRRRRVTVSIHDRIRGTLTLEKRASAGDLTFQLEGSTKRAAIPHLGKAFDALFLFWEYGELSPFVRWRSEASR